MPLHIKNLNFSYNNLCALENISFSAQEGQILGIIGPNGAGKTTLLKCINRTMKPKSGSVLIDDMNVALLNRKKIARLIGVVPQISKIFPFQVLDVIMMGRYPHLDGLNGESSHDFEAARRAMKLTGIQHLSERFIDELSGGELQKVIIARTIAQEPKILLLDEPITHLDINHQLEILELIKRITIESQLITILVSHNLNMAARYCDRLILLQAGKVHSIGSIEAVLTPEKIQDVFRVQTEIFFQKQIQSHQIILLKPT